MHKETLAQSSDFDWLAHLQLFVVFTYGSIFYLLLV